MATFTDVAALIPTLSGRLAEASDAVQSVLVRMPDADVMRVLEETAVLVKQVEQIQVAAAGVVAMRSKRERGHSGFSSVRGHRSAASLIQDVTGSTKADANRKVRVGEALLDEPGVDGESRAGGASDVAGAPGTGNDLVPGAGLDGAGESSGSGGDGSTFARSIPGPWHQPLRDALRESRLTSAQFDAIRRGLGEPPEINTDEVDQSDSEALAAAREEARAAWAQAAEQLVDEAAQRTVEELWQQARMIRDLLDPDGAEARFLERFEKRSFRTYRGQDGQKRASITLDDEGDLFLESMLAAGLRPRRGGPRFVDPDEKAQAAALVDDERTNDQLAYDLVMDVFRAGVLADAESVFGTRQAGVRLVQVIDQAGNTAPVAHSEDHLVSVPAAAAEQHICDSGIVPVTVDACGNPLDVGREQRLFTPKQRIGLAVRDGGCRWHDCDRPASYCEAHHIDEWAKDRGRTDIDRGILLCRYHHMTLHHGRWRITRRGKDDFTLHHPSGETFPMRPRAALSYSFNGIDPPPKRFRPSAA
jgi:hypothetical protein